MDDVLFYEPVIITDAEVEEIVKAEEEELNRVQRLSRTLLDLIQTNPALKQFILDYGKAS